MDFGVTFLEWNYSILRIDHEFDSIFEEVTKNKYAPVRKDVYQKILSKSQLIAKCDYNKEYYGLH